MTARLPALVLLLLALAAPVAAVSFSEDFEAQTAGENPTGDWYTYSEGSDVGNVTTTDPIAGSQAFIASGGAVSDVTAARMNFALATPTQLETIEFYVRGEAGSQQWISIQSSAPRRTMTEFYVFCDDANATQGCELRVRWEAIDTTGQVLVEADANETEWKIHIVPDWVEGEYCLYVDDVDDGCFPMLELPRDVGRLRIGQHSPSLPMALQFDNWNVTGAVNATVEEQNTDIATGFKNFVTDLNFTSTGSKFVFGVVMFIILLAAVLSPLFAVGGDNSLVPALGFFGVLVTMWLIEMEFWPDWIGVALIIAVSAIISTIVRRGVLGISNANQGPGLVAGSMGYFIIASTFLAFGGYSGDTVFLPTADQDIDADDVDALPENETVTQSFVAAVADCAIGIVSFGAWGDCSRRTEGRAIKWAKETVDTIGRVTATIFSYARAAVGFLFQLLTFQFPIPTIFNMMIVLPPASALATLAIQTARGAG